MIDDALACGRRGLRTLPGSLLLGPTGARLWADYLEERPGFVGAIDFIHKLNIPLLFTIEHGIGAPPEPAEAEWRPSHLTVRQRFGGLVLEERKYVTWDDRAVSLQRWRNEDDTAATLRLVSDPDWIGAAVDGVATGERAIPARGFTIRAAIGASDPALWDGVTLAPGATLAFTVVAALGLAQTDPFETLAAKLADLADGPAPADRLAAQVAGYAAWFDGAPRFSSSSALLDRTVAYRWFLYRHTLAVPGVAPFEGPLFYEGRSHKMTKTPWAPVGWEFSKLIPLSTPMHLIDTRWHADAGLGAAALRTLESAQGPDGQLYSRTLNEIMHPYANFTGWGAYQYALVHGLTEAVAAALPLLKRQVVGERENIAMAGDSLPVQVDHRLTGKEYQPSYWYFHGYPDDPLDKSTYTPVKRVDRAVYQYRNARGVAALCALVGDDEEARFTALAEEVAADILTKQWDAATGFFYDLHPETDEKAMVRNVVGFYPYWAGLTGPEHVPGLLATLTPEFFDTRLPFPSVSRDCPVHQPGGSWKGRFLKGRNGCMWDGPTWPYTNAIAIDALGRLSREAGHAHDDLFAKYFWKYVALHFKDQDGRTPYLVEHYDSASGEPISDEPDYSHSYFIDLVVRWVAGLAIDTGAMLRLDPIDIGLDRFRIDNLPYRGRTLAVAYEKGAGFSLAVDGTIVAERPDLGPLAWEGPALGRA
ncbi:MGH1-like glycoside hydrolase domain-containing protein [Prosthecomicrobium pneumaticum]|uniref:Mannosylglycerate hydrolase MGH1-like glycoside hydrolase domain-containing protein n=1 Tax=Prosthecomicrobium pneumaticum TaxID=81895 RepID=A0A7W9CTY8_9HYPH|nr:hypothetical protein [Prosthecomicrobium pneumaticum]MBB5751845.1 hypothetical protein [Prosthecomicrobium pneumaticum]